MWIVSSTDFNSNKLMFKYLLPFSTFLSLPNFSFFLDALFYNWMKIAEIAYISHNQENIEQDFLGCIKINSLCAKL